MSPSVEEIVHQIEKIPTINTVAFEVVQLCADKEIPIPRLVKVISGDLSLTSQILRIANSSYFNYPRTIYSLDRAIIILGFNLLRDIAVSLAIYSMYQGFKANKAYDLKQLWKHSLYTGFTLKVLAEDYDPENKDILYIGGLLHDIGKLVLIRILNQDYYLLLEKSQQENKRLSELEKKFLGFDHSEVGARLLDYWRLPDEVVNMAKFHHYPRKYAGAENNSPFVRLIYLGNLLSHLLESNQKNFSDLIKLDPYFEKNYSLSDMEVLQLLESVEKELAEQQEYIKLFAVDAI
ncbi:MAG: HDOD domain-containing protein [Calditrichia bacterium]